MGGGVIVLAEVRDLRERERGAVATVGNFDGLHRGHRTIVDRVLERARATGAAALLITFDPHPLKVIAPERAPRMLATRRQKLALLEEAGLEFVLILPFTAALAAVTAEEFVRAYLGDGLAAREVYVGENFNFGRGRAGNADLMVRLCRDLGIRAEVIREVRHLGSAVSSSRIRRAIEEGEIELANALLGRPYAVEGTVARGGGRGASLGFPTANLAVRNDLVPPDGVYVTEAVLAGRACPAVTNVGSRPTFPGASFAVETHLLEAGTDLYGAEIEVRFLQHLRPEMRFPSPQALVEQIHRDVDRARAYFSAVRPEDVTPS